MSAAIPRPVAKARKPRRSSGRPFVLPETLNIRVADELTLGLRQACKTSVPALDGSAVAEADTAGLQVLVAVAMTAHQVGSTLRWSGVSPALQAAAASLGLGTLLDLVEPSGRDGLRVERG